MSGEHLYFSRSFSLVILAGAAMLAPIPQVRAQDPLSTPTLVAVENLPDGPRPQSDEIATHSTNEQPGAAQVGDNAVAAEQKLESTQPSPSAVAISPAFISGTVTDVNG